MMSAFVAAGYKIAGVDFQTALPNDSAIDYSDYQLVDVSSSSARFSRSIVDGQGYDTCTPGARVRFTTNATEIVINLQYTNLVTRMDTYNGVGAILVDGAFYASFNRAQGAPGPLSVGVSFGASVSRLIEIVWPYCASVDLISIQRTAGSTLTAPSARSSTLYVAAGDSITHGFLANEVYSEWAYLLAQSKGWRFINMGYGSRQVSPTDATTIGALGASVATYLIGYNNFAAQTALATFKTNYKSWISNFRAGSPSCQLYCITPTWSPNSFGALTLENYRQQIRDAVSEIGSALNIVVEGEALATNSSAYFPDNVHPNNAAAVQIRDSLLTTVLV
jgi:lysophospholipase L1-like esterase